MPRTQREPASSILHATEVCSFCGQLYAYELERRCAECDAAMCLFCATHNEATEMVCVACGPSLAKGGS